MTEKKKTSKTSKSGKNSKSGKGKLISLSSLSNEYDITPRRLRRACKNANLTFVKAMVETDGGPQLADAVYENKVLPIIAELQIATVTTADITAHEAAAKLGVNVRRIKSAAIRENVALVKKLGTHKRGAFQPVDCMTKRGFDTLKKALQVLVAE